jgi:hypothetical protein
MLKIPEANEVIVGALAERGEWVVANVETSSPWPVLAQRVSYRGQIVWILPIMKGFYPAVAMKLHPGTSRETCSLLLMRFLSALAWVEAKGFLVDGIGGGSLPSPAGRDKTYGFSICEEFDLSYLPEPADDKALLALALMREGRGLNHPAYAFLSFYRVIEVAFPDGRRRSDWIGNRIGAIKDHFANEALAKLRDQGITEVGVHLRESGRCAIVHAGREPIIDPDDPSDSRRLSLELPIISALAQMAIEKYSVLKHVTPSGKSTYTSWPDSRKFLVPTWLIVSAVANKSLTNLKSLFHPSMSNCADARSIRRSQTLC